MTPPQAATPKRPTRQQQRREATIAEIKDRSREQLATGGAGALSLRAVARDMGLSSAAIYRYFPAQADLITALCVDTYNDLADTIERARTHDSDSAHRMRNVLSTFRTWALAHPSDFALIFGTPFPGYIAPPGETTEAAARFATALFVTYAEAADAGAVELSAVQVPADQGVGELADILVNQAAIVPPALAAGAISGWVSTLGFISAELWGNLGRIVDNTDTAFDAHLRGVMCSMGFNASDLSANNKEQSDASEVRNARSCREPGATPG